MICDCKNINRVAIVYHFFPHYREAVMQSLLHSNNYDYLLVAGHTDPDHSIKEWQPPQDKYVFAPCKKLFRDILWQRGVLRLCLKRDIKALIFLGNANWVSTWVAAILSRCLRKRVLFWTHGWVRRDTGIKAFVRLCFYRLAHGLLLYGNTARQIGLSLGFSSDRLLVVYNSLDYSKQKEAREKVTTDRINEIRSQYCSKLNIPLIIFTGRITRNCQIDKLLMAVAALKGEGIETSLLIVGNGPEKEMLQKLAIKLKVNVHFYGACYDENKLAELYMASDIAVSPGKIGLAAIHSLAYGTPVITHGDPDWQGPEHEAITPGINGDFFKRDNISDLTMVIRKWILAKNDRESIRKACYRVIEKYYNPDFQKRIIELALSNCL